MLTAEQRDTIRAARDAEARARAKRTRRIEDQLDLYADRDKEAEVTQETPQATEPSENGAAPEWTPETVIEAMLRWRDVRGSLPSSSDWQQRHEGYPTYTTVRKFFEGWPDALAAAANAIDAERTEDEPAWPGPDEPPVLAPPEANDKFGLGATDEPPVHPVGEDPSLSDLAAEYEAAHQAVEEAEARYQEVLERFRAHPLIDLAFSDQP